MLHTNFKDYESDDDEISIEGIIELAFKIIFYCRN